MGNRWGYIGVKWALSGKHMGLYRGYGSCSQEWLGFDRLRLNNANTNATIHKTSKTCNTKSKKKKHKIAANTFCSFSDAYPVARNIL